MRLQPDIKLLNLLDGLVEQARDLADVGGSQALTAATALREGLRDPELRVELVAFSEAGENLLPTVRAGLGLGDAPGRFQLEGTPCAVSSGSFMAVSSHRIEAIQPMLKIAVVPQAGHVIETWQDELIVVGSGVPWLLVLHEGGGELAPETRRALEEGRTLVEEGSLDQLATYSIKSRMAQAEFQAMVARAYDLIVALSIERVDGVLDLSLQQEERNLKARKALNQQQVLKVQAGAGPTYMDTSTQLKNALGQQFTQLEKGLNDTIEALAKPQTGALTRLVEKRLQDMPALVQEKKAKAHVLAIAPEYEQDFLNTVKTTLLRAGLDSLIMMRDAVRTLEDEVERVATRLGVPAPTWQFRLLTDASLKDILTNTVNLDRGYEGSMTRKGFYEFFMAIRKYQMLVFMMVSTLGLSFVRNLSHIMIPVTVGLLGFGAVITVRSMRKEREEGGDKELEKARESLRSEARRIGTEFTRQWSRVVSDHLRGQSAQIIQQIEAALKDHFQKLGTEEEEAKRKVQRMVQSADSAERKFTNIQRDHGSFQRDLSRLKGDLRQGFLQQARKTAR